MLVRRTEATVTEGCSVVPLCCCRLQTAAGVAACEHVCVARQQPSSSCAALRTLEAPSGATGAPLSRAGRRAGAASGDCVFLEAESDADSCTHVVARHAEQPSVGWAAARGRQAVTHFWVWECCRAQHLLPLGDPVRSHSCPAAPVCTCTSLRASCSAHSTGVCSGASLQQSECRLFEDKHPGTDAPLRSARQLYRPARAAALPGAGGVQATLTGFQGAQRQHVLELLRMMGVHVQKSMQLSTITHVVAKDTQSTASAKLCFARTCARRRPLSSPHVRSPCEG